MNDDEVVEAFLNEICERFPEIKPLMEVHDDFMTTSKMEAFAIGTKKAIENENIEKAEGYLTYMSKKLIGAHPKEHEFIDVYYMEDLFWQASNKAICTGWDIVPDNLKKLYIEFHGQAPL